MSLTGKASAERLLRGKINGLEKISGYSAYEIALIHGFEGTEEEWLESLNYVLTEADKDEIAGIVIEEGAVAEEVAGWLDEHPEATTTVQDGSLTAEKLTDELKLATINEFVTPQMYGAKGDGVADDTEAVQAALDSFVGEAGEIFFPQGQYRITAPLTIRSNIRLSGVSSAIYGRYNSDIPSTVIFYDGSENVESFIKYDRDGNTVFGGGISNLTLDGRKKVNYIVNLSRSGGVVLSNNTFTNSLVAGVYSIYAYENTIKGNWFGYNSGYAIVLDTHANATVVRDNSIALSGESSGILLQGCNGNVITANFIEGGHGASIGIRISPTGLPSRNMITDNRIEFQSNRYDGQTEGICILVGEEGGAEKPHRTSVKGNAVFNQVVRSVGAETDYNHKNEFVDYGLGTVTDFYDPTVLNENPKMLFTGGALVGYSPNDPCISFAEGDGFAKVVIKNAAWEYPLAYQAVDVKNLRGEAIALSCMIKRNNTKLNVGIEYYKNGTDKTWGYLGEYITAKRYTLNDVGEYRLVQIDDIVPDDCDTAVISINFGTDGKIPADGDVDVKWCKLTRYATWK